MPASEAPPPIGVALLGNRRDTVYEKVKKRREREREEMPGFFPSPPRFLAAALIAPTCGFCTVVTRRRGVGVFCRVPSRFAVLPAARPLCGYYYNEQKRGTGSMEPYGAARRGRSTRGGEICVDNA